MKKWLWGVVTGVFLTFAFFLIAGFLAWRLRARAPEVRTNTVLVADLQGGYDEQPSSDLPGQLLNPEAKPTFLEVVQSIEDAANDPRVTAILLKPADLQLGWAKLEQLRSALGQFKGKGKKVLALLGTAGSAEYFLASAADQVYLSPVGVLEMAGMHEEVMFFKDTLTKLGVQAELEHIGRYKNFSDQFTDDHMNDSFREVENSVLDSVYGNFIGTIAPARRRTADEMRAAIEQNGPFTAENAVRFGLVDGLRYEDQILDDLKAASPDHEVHQLSLDDYSRVSPPQTGGDRIAVVYAVGEITSGEDSIDPLEGGKTMGAKTMAKTLRDVGNDKSIKGVIVRIDSPGGDAFASDAIWRDMVGLHKKKPMVVSMSDLAASGGYYMAMTGDPLVAEPGTLTGSVGIVYGKLDMKGLYDKVGITKELLTRGQFSDMDSDYHAYTPEELDRVRAMMQDFYSKFVGKVASARKMTPEAVDKLAQGRVWTGEQAKSNGLVDDLGGLSRAVELIKQKAGIRPEAKVVLVEYPPRKSLFELLLSRAQGQEMKLPFGLAKWIAQWRLVESLSKSPFLARMPYALELR